MAKKVRILAQYHARRGSAAVAALVSLSLLICLGMALARLMKIEADATQNFHEGIAAQCIAEAGLRRAIVVLYNNGNPHGLVETFQRPPFVGQYRLSTSDEGGLLRLRSVGNVGGARRTASVLVRLTPGAADEPSPELTILSWNN